MSPTMPENTRSSELAKTLEESLLSFGFQGAQRKCYTPKYGKDAYIIEEWSAETLATFIVDDLLAWHASKVTELDNLKLVCNAELPSTYTDPLTGKKLYNEAHVASKVEEARIDLLERVRSEVIGENYVKKNVEDESDWCMRYKVNDSIQFNHTNQGRALLVNAVKDLQRSALQKIEEEL